MTAKLACSTACFPHASIDGVLEEIRGFGFDAMDLTLIPGLCDHFDPARQPPVERQDFVALIRNSRLLVPTVTAAPGHFNFPPDRFEFIVRPALALLKLAAQLGSEALNLACGGPVADPGQFQAAALVQARGLKEIAQEAAQLGLQLNLWAPHRQGLCRNLDQARFLLEQIRQDNVRLVLDVTQWQAVGVSPADAVRALEGRIGHVRLDDGAGPELPVFFEALERAGYDGYCAIELDTGEDMAEGGRRLSRFRCLLQARLADLKGVASAPSIQA